MKNPITRLAKWYLERTGHVVQTSGQYTVTLAVVTQVDEKLAKIARIRRGKSGLGKDSPIEQARHAVSQFLWVLRRATPKAGA